MLLSPSFLDVFRGQERGVLEETAEFFLADVMVGAFAGGEVFVGFVFHFQSLQMHDLKVLVALIPDLALLQLHWNKYTRQGGGAARANVE